MQLSYSNKKRSAIEYYPLPNGYADVFLRKNELGEPDNEGNIGYVAEEVYFQIEQSVTQQEIEDNFEYMWNDAQKTRVETVITETDRIEALENALLEMMGVDIGD